VHIKIAVCIEFGMTFTSMILIFRLAKICCITHVVVIIFNTSPFVDRKLLIWDIFMEQPKLTNTTGCC